MTKEIPQCENWLPSKTIADVQPIAGADRITAYRINGWYVVDQIGRFTVGETVLYIEPDAFVPHSLAPFLSDGKEPDVYEGITGQRLRTKRLNGVYSQGIILPNTFPNKNVGDDVTDELGIVKWEKPIPASLQGLAKGQFPSSCPKTDEERVQNLMAEWHDYVPHAWEVTEKLEGMSTTFGLDGDEFVCCSRNLSLQEAWHSVQWQFARLQRLEEKMRELALKNIFI